MEAKSGILKVVNEEMALVKKELDLQKMMEQAGNVVEDLCESFILPEVSRIAENAIEAAYKELELKIDSLLRRY